MKKHYHILTAFLLLALCGSGCANLTTSKSDPDRRIVQISTIDALLAASYEGQMSGAQLLTHGDSGIGTFENLDGEMIIKDSKIYQIKSDGKVYQPDNSIKTPFASVTRAGDLTNFPLSAGMSLKDLEAYTDAKVPEKNHPVFIRIDGSFKKMITRSVPAQKKPYPPLIEVTKKQPVFENSNVKGTIIGFRSPAYVKGVNVPGYHLHFLSDDLKSGGHILNFEVEEAELKTSVKTEILIILPEPGSSFDGTDLKKDRSKELEQAEKLQK